MFLLFLQKRSLHEKFAELSKVFPSAADKDRKLITAAEVRWRAMFVVSHSSFHFVRHVCAQSFFPFALSFIVCLPVHLTSCFVF